LTPMCLNLADIFRFKHSSELAFFKIKKSIGENGLVSEFGSESYKLTF